VLAVTLGPFADRNAPAAPALHHIHLYSFPPGTPMTGNTTQMVLDAVDLMQ
jgi:hypothetical protein